MKIITTVLTAFILLAVTQVASPQDGRFELAGVFTTTFQKELDAADLGIGVRAGYLVMRLVTLEDELDFYPTDLPGRFPVSSSRFEGLFGVKIGPRYDRFSFFGKARTGFVRFGAATEPVACIAIFPPPLNCVLAEGRTVPALDLGGGIELYPSERTFARVDVSNLLLRYPGPAFTRAGDAVADEHFWRANPRLTFSFGLRF